MLLRAIYERIQMNRIVNLKGNRSERHACASSNICRMAYAITVLTPAGAKKKDKELLCLNHKVLVYCVGSGA
jgi:hypothetical protein